MILCLIEISGLGLKIPTEELLISKNLFLLGLSVDSSHFMWELFVTIFYGKNNFKRYKRTSKRTS